MHVGTQPPLMYMYFGCIHIYVQYVTSCRTFGYVARDQTTRKHKCHVFRCDMPARAVAKALLENHQKMTNKPTSVPPMTTVTAGGRENSQTPPTQRRIGR